MVGGTQSWGLNGCFCINGRSHSFTAKLPAERQLQNDPKVGLGGAVGLGWNLVFWVCGLPAVVSYGNR